MDIIRANRWAALQTELRHAVVLAEQLECFVAQKVAVSTLIATVQQAAHVVQYYAASGSHLLERRSPFAAVRDRRDTP